MNHSQQPLVSILTPVYNGEKFLSECIESVLAQTYENWEYIIINNCSTDGSRDIAMAYTRKDRRIRIHDNTKFVDALENHNIAFRLISRESAYCKVVHADDWLFPDCVAKMVAVAEAHPSVAIVGAYRIEGSRVSLGGLPYPSEVVSGREICRRTLLGRIYVFGSPTSILIRSEATRNRKALFNVSNIHADKEACFDLLQNSDFGFVHQVLTYTRRHEAAGTIFSKSFHTLLLGNLMILKKYGPIYLDAQEFREKLRLHLKRYHTYLARIVLYQHDKRLFDYHRNGLKNLGYNFSWTKLLGALLIEVADLLFNPKTTIERAVRRVSQSSRGSERSEIVVESGRRHGALR